MPSLTDLVHASLSPFTLHFDTQTPIMTSDSINPAKLPSVLNPIIDPTWVLEVVEKIELEFYMTITITY